MKHIKLVDWNRIGEKVELTFSDGDKFFVKYEDFNRTFASFVNADKEVLRKDFAVV